MSGANGSQPVAKYESNDSAYLSYLGQLAFDSIPFSDKGDKYSILGECHRNCENYVQAHGGQQILGWLKQSWGHGVRFLMHSCVLEGGKIINITPPALVSPTDIFAHDPNIAIDPNVTNIFRFVDKSNNRELPKYFETTTGK